MKTTERITQSIAEAEGSPAKQAQILNVILLDIRDLLADATSRNRELDAPLVENAKDQEPSPA
jgi:hypothetical protein